MVISLLNSKRLKKAASHVQSLMKAYLPTDLVFHDLIHTQQVVEAAQEIGRACLLSNSDMELLLIAAWFHDVGYIAGYQDHVKLSQEIAKNWLKQEGVSTMDSLKIIKCIGPPKCPKRRRTFWKK